MLVYFEFLPMVEYSSRKHGKIGMKKILHITFNMGTGGTESVIKEIIYSCNTVKHEVLCIDGIIGPLGESLSKDGVPVHAIQRKPGINLSIINKIRKLIRNRKIDLVHCHQYTPLFYGGISSFLEGKDYIFTEHGRHFPDRKRYKAIFINKFLFARSKSNIAISESTKKSLITNEFCPRNKVKVIYNGIDDTPKSVKTKNDSPTFICVARFDKNKNQSSIVKAVKYLKDNNKIVHVDFYGDGPELNNVKSIASDLGVLNQLDFKGFVKEPSSNFGRYKGLILASYTEGTSMVILEAFREKLPVIASNVGGTKELIHDNKTGLLFPANDHIEIGNCINKLNDSLSRKISSSANIEFLRYFSSKSMAKRYLNEYK